MIKKILALVLALIICLCFVACSSGTDNTKSDTEETKAPIQNEIGTPEPVLTESEGLAYELNAEGSAYTVIGIGECTDTDIVIPETYEGLPVTAIGTGEETLIWNEEVKSISIPDSVTKINDCAFIGCVGITEIIVPDSVTSIGYGAFGFCENLEAVTLPDTITSIEDLTFGNCYKLKEITIPASVLTIGEQAFFSCTSLEKVILKNKSTAIHEHAFDDDSTAKTVYEDM